MSKKRRKGRALRRRYGHFGMADIRTGAAKLRSLASAHPAVTAAAIGATSAALASGMTTGAAAVLGATAGIAIHEADQRGG